MFASFGVVVTENIVTLLSCDGDALVYGSRDSPRCLGGFYDGILLLTWRKLSVVKTHVFIKL